jgi:transposase
MARFAQLVTTSRSRRDQVAERCRYVLLNAAGWSVPQIAQRFVRNEHTMRKWLTADHTQGLAGLDHAAPPGRPATKGQPLEQPLDILVTQAPSAYGYIEAGWTVEVLRDYLGQQDLQVSDTTVRRRLQSGGWVSKCFTKTLPKNAPTAEKKTPGWQSLLPPYKGSSRSVL